MRKGAVVPVARLACAGCGHTFKQKTVEAFRLKSGDENYCSVAGKNVKIIAVTGVARRRE